MSEMVVIGREQEVFPFRLVGARVLATADADETQDTVERLIADKKVSLVLITEEAAVEAEDMLGRFRFQHPAVVMTIPTPLRDEGLGPEALRRLIEEAIGTDLLGKME